MRSYAAGVDRRGLRRLVDRDAERAWRVLVSEREEETRAQTKKKKLGLFTKARLLFLGISDRLTPARRALFAGSIFVAIVGSVHLEIDGSNFQLNSSPLALQLAIAGLVFLLVLEMTDRILVRDELELARQLQRDLLPTGDPELPGWRFAHSTRTAREVGGDWYGFDSEPDGSLRLAVADASGHGMAAGLLAAIANATLKSAKELGLPPVESTRLLHRVLRSRGPGRGFVTLFLALLEPESGRLRWTSAAHPSPLLRRANGALEELARGAPPLGLGEECHPESGETTLSTNDLLVLFTDGLYETVGADGEPFGWERLRALVATGGSAAAVCERLLGEYDRRLGDEEPSDDLTLLIVERTG